MTADNDGERPRWSVTWLFRLQRVGRNPRPREPGEPGNRHLISRIFPWAVLLLLIIEVAVGVWLGLIPR